MFASLFLYLYPQLLWKACITLISSPFLYISFVGVMRFITNRKYVFFCINFKIYNIYKIFVYCILWSDWHINPNPNLWDKKLTIYRFNYHHSWQLRNCTLRLTNANCFFVIFWFCCKLPLLVRHAFPVIIMSLFCCLRTTAGLEIKRIMCRNEDSQRLFLPWNLQRTVP